MDPILGWEGPLPEQVICGWWHHSLVEKLLGISAVSVRFDLTAYLAGRFFDVSDYVAAACLKSVVWADRSPVSSGKAHWPAVW